MAKWDNNSVLPSAMVSWLAQWLDISTSRCLREASWSFVETLQSCINNDDDDADGGHIYSAWFHWLKCSMHWRRLQIENGPPKKSIGKKSFVAQWVQQTLKRKSQSENRWVFRRLRNVIEESASLIVCGRAFQSLGAELEKAMKPSWFSVCFFSSTWNP